MDFEKLLNFKIVALITLAIFYAIYFVKMYLQSKKGIRTHQIGVGKEKRRKKVETVMSFATVLVVVVQILSIAFSWNIFIPSNARFTGFLVAMLGNLLFLISVCTMKDSWRAGIPASDKTDFITNGIYHFSRNPAFLGFDFMYIGVLLMFFNPLTIVFTVFAIISLHFQILEEEKYLVTQFGEQYLEYKKHVFRYLGRR